MRRLLVLTAIAISATALPSSAAAARHTFVANCNNTYYLDFKPHYWSAGCTGGSYNLRRMHWTHWGKRVARGHGQATLRKPCGTNPTCPEAGIYKAKARLRLRRPRRCTSGPAAGKRFFSRVRLRIRYRRGNPFGIRPGWHTYRFKISAYQGHCEHSP